jgi:ribonuclease D
MAIDQPARFVLADLAVVALAQRAPTRVEDLRAVRGVEDRHTRGEVAKGLLAAIADGLEHPVESTSSSGETELERSLRPAVTLVSAWVAQVARAEEIDTALLATRADLVELLAGAPEARLGTGWRGALVGEGIRSLVAGESALAFSGRGRLRLLPVVGDAAVAASPVGEALVNDPG